MALSFRGGGQGLAIKKKIIFFKTFFYFVAI